MFEIIWLDLKVEPVMVLWIMFICISVSLLETLLQTQTKRDYLKLLKYLKIIFSKYLHQAYSFSIIININAEYTGFFIFFI